MGRRSEIVALMHVLKRPVMLIDADLTVIRNDLNGFSGDPIFIYYDGCNHYGALILEEGTDPREVLTRLLRPSVRRDPPPLPLRLSPPPLPPRSKSARTVKKCVKDELQQREEETNFKAGDQLPFLGQIRGGLSNLRQTPRGQAIRNNTEESTKKRRSSCCDNMAAVLS
jgi:hypothetical protein